MTKPAAALVAAAIVWALAAGCSSTDTTRVAASRAPSTTATVATTTTKPAQLQVTVPDCGAGAYRPATLLIVCNNGGTMATEVEWTAWSSSGASGTGTVFLQIHGTQQSGRASLQLTDVADKGTSGPQFTRLTVTWIGRSPDGHPNDTFELGNSA
jgi:hypothetical protein